MRETKYTRLKGLLKDVAEKQRTVAESMLEAEKRFAVTEKDIYDLLDAIRQRRRNR
jgi:uncharacterized protein YqiB (DUF1249 family)